MAYRSRAHRHPAQPPFCFQRVVLEYVLFQCTILFFSLLGEKGGVYVALTYVPEGELLTLLACWEKRERGLCSLGGPSKGPTRGVRAWKRALPAIEDDAVHLVALAFLFSFWYVVVVVV